MNELYVRAADGQFYQRINLRDEFGRDPVPYEAPGLIQRVQGLWVKSYKANWLRGIDLSKWNGKVDHAKIAELYDFAFVKACQDRTVDAQYERNANEFAKINFDFGLYAFTDPQYSSGIVQARFFADLVAGNLSMVMDAERTGGKDRERLSDWYTDFWGELGVILPNKKKENYNRSSFWNSNTVPRYQLKNGGLWIARYADFLSGPWADGKYIPRDWSDWVLWQYTDRGDGKEIGESYGLDLNYFNGDRAAFNAHYNLGDVVVPPIPPPNGGDCLWSFENIKRVRYRSQPIIEKQYEVGYKNPGDIVAAQAVVVPNGNEAWLEFEQDEEIFYTALIHWGSQYYQPL